MPKKFVLAFIAVLVLSVLFSSCAFATRRGNSVHLGLLNYLGTTEDEFQKAVDDLQAKLPDYFNMLYVKEQQDLVATLNAFKGDRKVIHFYDSLTSMLMALEAGRVDQISLPEFTARYIMKNDPEYRIVFTLNTPFAISLGFREKDTALKDEIDKVLTSMKEDGTLKALAEKYINPDVTPEAVAFENFEGADKITVAVTGDMPPIDFVAENGKPAGYNTAVLSEIGKRLKKNIEVISIESGARSSALVSGRADIIFWYKTTKGLGLPDPSKDPVKDSTEGVILSVPYYEWERTLLLTK